MTRWLLIIVLALLALFVYTRERRVPRVTEEVLEYETLCFGDATTIRVRQPDASEFMPGVKMKKIERPSIDSIESTSTALKGGSLRYITHSPYGRNTKSGPCIIIAGNTKGISAAESYGRGLAAVGMQVHTLLPMGRVTSGQTAGIREQLALLIKRVHLEGKVSKLFAECRPDLLEISLLLAGWRHDVDGQTEVGLRRMYDGLVIRGARPPVLRLLTTYMPARGSAPLLIIGESTATDDRLVDELQHSILRSVATPAGSRTLLWAPSRMRDDAARRELEQRMIESFYLYGDAVTMLGGIEQAQETVTKLGGIVF